MSDLLIEFDKKSLVIPKTDYKTFQNENYHLDDGTTHIFSKENNCLLVLDANDKPDIAIFFNSIILQGEVKQEIWRIKYRLKSNIDPQKDFNQAQKVVFRVMEKAFMLLDNILRERASDDDDFTVLGYNYYVKDKELPLFDFTCALEERLSYFTFLPKLEYVFGVLPD